MDPYCTISGSLVLLLTHGPILHHFWERSFEQIFKWSRSEGRSKEKNFQEEKVGRPKFRVSDRSKQVVQERRNFEEGISSRSEQGFSSHVHLWHREVVTIRILCTVLNSKTASRKLFLIFELDPKLHYFRVSLELVSSRSSLKDKFSGAKA